MKKIFALMMVLVMVLSVGAVFAGCKETETPPTAGEDQKEPTKPEPTTPPEEAQETFKSFLMNMNNLSLEAYVEEDGQVMLNYATETDYQYGKVDPSVLKTLTKALEESGYETLKAPEGEEDFGGEAKLEINFGGGETFVYEYYHSQIPEDFRKVYEKMDAAFQEAVKLLPEPEVDTDGEVAQSEKDAMKGILEHLELWASANHFAMTSVPVTDEAFNYTVGLSSSQGIVSGMQFGPKTGSVPYKLYMVTVADGTDVSTIAKDYRESVDWRVFGCVFPDHAYIATKGNQVLMLLGKDDEYGTPYTQTVDAIKAAGWTLFEELTNPDIG